MLRCFWKFRARLSVALETQLEMIEARVSNQSGKVRCRRGEARWDEADVEAGDASRVHQFDDIRVAMVRRP